MVVGLTQFACASGYHAFPSLDSRSPQKQRADQFQKCSGSETKVWDVGTGSLEDIAERAPQFYTFESGQGSYGNDRQISHLRDATLPDALSLGYRTVAGHRLAEFESPASRSKRIVMFSNRTGSKVMLVPSACPHIRVKEACVNGRTKTSVTTEGTLACFKGISGELMLNGTGVPNNTSVRPGDAIPVSASGGTFVTLDWRTERVFSGPVGENQFNDPTPEMLLGVLKNGDDSTAFTVFNQMEPQEVSPELRNKIEEMRVARVSDQLASMDVFRVLETTSFDESFPGSTKIRQLVDQKLVDSMQSLVDSPATGPGFWRGIRIMESTINVSALPLDEFVEKYGAFMVEQDYEHESQNVREAADEFVRRWPQSTWAGKINSARSKVAREANARAEAARKKQEAADKEEAAEERSRCAARCEHKCMAGIYGDKALCRRGCINYECDGNFCEGACEVDCSRFNKAGQPGCVSKCKVGRCGQ